MTHVTTHYYNNSNKAYRVHRGLPRKGESFDRNSADATRIVIEYMGAYSFEKKVFTKDAQGRWVSYIRFNGQNYYRDELVRKQTLIHFTSVMISNEEAQAIIRQEIPNIMEAARQTISWCKPEDENDEDGRYWLSAYHGAQTYRLIVKGAKILGSIPGGFHDSRSCYCSDEAWKQALIAAVKEKVGEDFHLLKADGSGTYFYLRNQEDARYLEVKEYDVPDMTHGGLYHNVEVLPTTNDNE